MLRGPGSKLGELGSKFGAPGDVGTPGDAGGPRVDASPQKMQGVSGDAGPTMIRCLYE